MTDPNTQPVDEPVEQDGRSFAIEGNDTSGYVGVDPEYRNYANETDRPILSDETVEHMKEHGHLTDDEAVEQGRGLWAPTSGEGDSTEEPATPEEPTDPARKDDDELF